MQYWERILTKRTQQQRQRHYKRLATGIDLVIKPKAKWLPTKVHLWLLAKLLFMEQFDKRKNAAMTDQGYCEVCGHNPNRDHLGMKDKLQRLQAMNTELLEAHRDIVELSPSPNSDCRRNLEEAVTLARAAIAKTT